MTAQLNKILLVSAASLALIAGCGRDAGTTTNTSPTATASEAQTSTAETGQTAKINQWFEEQFEASVARSPMTQTFLGRKTNYDKWDNATEEFEQESYELQMAALEEMRQQFSLGKLDPSAQLSYRLFEYEAEQEQRNEPFRNHWYVFSNFRGPHSSAPAFLINQHRVDTLEDAEAYVARLEEQVDAWIAKQQA